MRTREEISKYNKEYRLSHKEYFKKKNDEYTLNSKETISERKKNYYLTNKENQSDYKKKYYNENKEKVNKNSVKRVNNKKREDSVFKLKCNIRGLINSSITLSGYRKMSKTQNILGCTFDEFKLFLESKFEPWMNWSNHGNWNGSPKEINTAWDIDHIVPISSAKTEEEVIRLNHYSNFQPLCSYTNRHIKRGNFIKVENVFIMDNM